ncbi:hypothetical protein INT45_002945 [Circinella minor]|uniref:Uncharacterized protein n=1 Tax=Circinella minor TaxID=1195481 RepID=A0A8H7VIS7_9FUNG|nr:hypothetical protein INT45_002945 [Circinella minor]
MYSILGRSVLGEELWNPVYLTTFKRTVKPLAARVAYTLRSQANLPASFSWSDLNAGQKHEVVDMLERLTAVMFPFEKCVGYWGAGLLMVRAWNKIRANGDNQEGEQVPQQHSDTHVTQKECVVSDEELVQSGDQSDTTLPSNPDSWLEEDKINQESQDILLGVELTSAVKESSSDDIPILVEQGRVGRPRGRFGAIFRS